MPGGHYTPPDLRDQFKTLADRIAALERAPSGLVKLADLTLAAGGASGAGAGQLGINDIPQGFSHLRLVIQSQSQFASDDNVGVRLNGVASSYTHMVRGYSQAGVFDSSATAQSYCYVGNAPGTGRTNNNYVGRQIVQLPFYSTTDTAKTWHSVSVMQSTAAAYSSASIQGVYSAGPSAITALAVFAVNGALGPRARATLYGIA